MQHVQNGVHGVRVLAHAYGDTVLVATLIVAALSFAVSMANILSATL